jgi:hypothetical protein
VACALVAQASPAAAFCRNTTCKDTDKKTCLKDDKGCTTEGNASSGRPPASSST